MINSAEALTSDLLKEGISVSDDTDYNNIIFTYNGKGFKMASHIWARLGGMCMTHGFIRKDKSGSVIVKWVPITNEMYYNTVKLMILKRFGMSS